LTSANLFAAVRNYGEYTAYPRGTADNASYRALALKIDSVLILAN
jgi:hypothetical protein